MTLFFTLLAVAGGTLLLCQTAATLLGVGGDNLDADFDADAGDFDAGDFDADGPDLDAGDADGDHHGGGHSSLVGALSFRTLTAAATFAGLGGLIAQELHLALWLTLPVAAAAGTAALLVVHRVMRTLHRLGADGTVDPAAATGGVAGRYGTVYVRVPADGAGAGKVLVEYASRTVELAATTVGPALPSGTPVLVRAVTGPDAVDVAAVNPDDPTPAGLDPAERR